LNLSKEVRPFELYSFVLNNLEGRKKFVERLGKDCEDAIDEFVNLTIEFECEHIPTL
jgi:ATP-dependent helicase/nuclease subunit A